MSNFGKDTSCVSSVRTGRYVNGLRLVAESVFRRLTTPRGMLLGGEDEENFGLDLTELIGSASTTADAAALPGRIRSELLKDERIESVDVNVVSTVRAGAVSYIITIEAFTSLGPFTLTLAASDVTVSLVGLAEG